MVDKTETVEASYREVAMTDPDFDPNPEHAEAADVLLDWLKAPNATRSAAAAKNLLIDGFSGQYIGWPGKLETKRLGEQYGMPAIEVPTVENVRITRPLLRTMFENLSDAGEYLTEIGPPTYDVINALTYFRSSAFRRVGMAALDHLNQQWNVELDGISVAYEYLDVLLGEIEGQLAQELWREAAIKMEHITSSIERLRQRGIVILLALEHAGNFQSFIEQWFETHFPPVTQVADTELVIEDDIEDIAENLADILIEQSIESGLTPSELAAELQAEMETNEAADE